MSDSRPEVEEDGMDTQGPALVTGASRGIGRAVAVELASRGFSVTATMRDPLAGADLPESVHVAQLDVTDGASIVLPDGLRVLINNAGVDGENLSLEDTPIEEWRRQFETNVFGLVEVTRRAVPLMRAAGGGVIVNLTSSSILAPMPFYSVYRATKAAVQAISESLRTEVAPFGIHVMEVLPGPVDTDMLAASKIPSTARRTPPYRDMAERVEQLRQGELPTAVDEAARVIVDAICAAPPPRRIGCDPLGAALLSGWATTPDDEWQASFGGVFAPDLTLQ
jgi:NAD(P)-dependent dehydrogenase (short-subunit alcohol dehydrogenase family)